MPDRLDPMVGAPNEARTEDQIEAEKEEWDRRTRELFPNGWEAWEAEYQAAKGGIAASGATFDWDEDLHPRDERGRFGPGGGGGSKDPAERAIGKIQADIGRVRELLDAPLFPDGSSRPDWNATVPPKDWADQRDSLLVTTMAGVVPGPRMFEAEELTRKVGRDVYREAVRRAGADPDKLEREGKAMLRAAKGGTKAEIEAKRAAAEEMISNRWGSVESARSQIIAVLGEAEGQRAYDRLFRDLTAAAGAAGKYEPDEMARTGTDPTDPWLGVKGIDDPGWKPEWEYHGKPVADARAETGRTRVEAYAKLREANDARVAIAANARAVMDDLRGLGNPSVERIEARFDIPNPMLGVVSQEAWQAEAEEKLAAACSVLPADWATRSNGIDRLAVTPEASGGRGYCFDSGERIGAPLGASADLYAHELVHRLQGSDPAWRAMDNTFLFRRTTEEKITADTPPSIAPREDTVKLADTRWHSGYRDDEVTRKDQFGNPYVGKVYVKGTDGMPLAFEVSTMGVQAWARDASAEDNLFRTPESTYRDIPGGKQVKVGGIDRDFIDYTLGIVATMGEIREPRPMTVDERMDYTDRVAEVAAERASMLVERLADMEATRSTGQWVGVYEDTVGLIADAVKDITAVDPSVSPIDVLVALTDDVDYRTPTTTYNEQTLDTLLQNAAFRLGIELPEGTKGMYAKTVEPDPEPDLDLIDRVGEEAAASIGDAFDRWVSGDDVDDEVMALLTSAVDRIHAEDPTASRVDILDAIVEQTKAGLWSAEADAKLDAIAGIARQLM